MNLDACIFELKVRTERRKSHFQGPVFQNFPGEDAPGPPYSCCTWEMHRSGNLLDPPLPEKAASNMENLINKVKSSTTNIAVSGVIKRYDGKVNNNIIYNYNKLIHSICAKQNIAFIDNSCIDKPLLNRSNLHLNREGDRTLGSAFCTYLTITLLHLLLELESLMPYSIPRPKIFSGQSTDAGKNRLPT